jgi:hypothetical protein
LDSHRVTRFRLYALTSWTGADPPGFFHLPPLWIRARGVG